MSTNFVARAVHCVRSSDECLDFRDAWDEILAGQNSAIEQLDFTAGFDWTMSLWRTHLKSADQEVYVLRDGSNTKAILPLYRFQKRVRGMPCRTVAPFPELYGGRTGFLLSGNHHLEILEHVFAKVQEYGRWDALMVTLVEGSGHEQDFLALAARQDWKYFVLSEQRSPYFLFLDTWANHFASLPKKLRSTMRNGEKRLNEKGHLEYRECRSPAEVADFNMAVETVERDSWKAAAGTSIASDPVHDAFHRDLAIRAAESGHFSGHLLLLNGQPIAYLMGLLDAGVFLDLKESYCASFRETSPAHVLKYFAFPRLYERGTRVYDFMGKCEEYKLKWTDKIYCRRTYLALSNTWRGKAASLLVRYAAKREPHAAQTAKTMPTTQNEV